MEAKTAHTATPTPWSYKQLTGAARGYALFWSDNSKPGTWQRRVDQYSNIGPNGEFTEQDAAFIVRACNAHDELVKALRDARAYVERESEISGYGFFRPANPHNFFPDAEACSEEEIAAHKAACEAYDRGEYTEEARSGWVGDTHILRAPWGIGGYNDVDPRGQALLDRIDAALAAAEQA